MPLVQVTSREAIDRTIADFSRRASHVYFAQIGSNDGVRGDPIRRHILRDRWSGLLVEPVPYLFERLRALYPRRRGLRFENCAISDRDGVRTLYRLRETDEKIPGWYEGLATFFPEVLLKHRWSIPEFEARVISEPVCCLTLESLFRRHRIPRLDVFHVDTEGFDGEVLRQFDFDRFRPSLILFEHKHLDQTEREATYARLRIHGYSISAEPVGGDSLAVRSWRSRFTLR